MSHRGKHFYRTLRTRYHVNAPVIVKSHMAAPTTQKMTMPRKAWDWSNSGIEWMYMVVPIPPTVHVCRMQASTCTDDELTDRCARGDDNDGYCVSIGCEPMHSPGKEQLDYCGDKSLLNVSAKSQSHSNIDVPPAPDLFQSFSS